MTRKHINAAQQHACDGRLSQSDLTDILDVGEIVYAERRSLVDKLTTVQREILKLHRQGLPVQDLAVLFGINDADLHLLIFGPDEDRSP